MTTGACSKRKILDLAFEINYTKTKTYAPATRSSKGTFKADTHDTL